MPLLFRQSVRGVDLFPDPLFRLPRLGCLLRLRGCAARCCRTGAGQTAAAQDEQQKRKRRCVTHGEYQFTSPDRFRNYTGKHDNLVTLTAVRIRRDTTATHHRETRSST